MKQRRTHVALVFGTICLGSFLRIHNFWVPPVWIDEYGTWWVVAGKNWVDVVDRTLRIQGQSPFYYLIVKASVEIAGYGSFQLRLPSVLFGILTLVVVYPLAFRIFEDQRLALLYLIIFGTSEPFIWYSQIARPYALALFFSLVSFWSFVYLQKAQTIVIRALFVLSTALSVYAHYLFGFIVIIQGIYLAVSGGYTRFFSRFWLTNFLTIAVLLGPASGQLIYLHHQRHVLDWMASVDESWKVASVLIYLIGGASPFAIVAIGIMVVGMGFDHQQFRCQIRKTLTLPLIWYSLPLIGFLLVPSLIGVTLIQPRYLLFAYPATYLLLASVLFDVNTGTGRRWLPAAVFVMATIVCVSIPAISQSGTFARWPNRAWNDALAALPRTCKPDELIVAQIGLVEADKLSSNQDDPILSSYLSWPLVTTLSRLEQKNIAILPYHYTAATQAYFDSLVAKAVNYRRICLVGGGDSVSLFRERLMKALQYGIRSETTFGDDFHVFLLEKRSQQTLDAPERRNRLSSPLP